MMRALATPATPQSAELLFSIVSPAGSLKRSSAISSVETPVTFSVGRRKREALASITDGACEDAGVVGTRLRWRAECRMGRGTRKRTPHRSDHIVLEL